MVRQIQITVPKDKTRQVGNLLAGMKNAHGVSLMEGPNHAMFICRYETVISPWKAILYLFPREREREREREINMLYKETDRINKRKEMKATWSESAP